MASPREMPAGSDAQRDVGHLSNSPLSREGRNASVSTVVHLGSPAGASKGSPPVRQIPTPRRLGNGSSGAVTPLPGVDGAGSLPGPGQSALAAALQNSSGQSPPRFGTPPLRPRSPLAAGPTSSTYGSLDARPPAESTTYEDPEIVKRHLVFPNGSPSVATSLGEQGGRSSSQPAGSRGRTATPRSATAAGPSAPGAGDEEFSSLQLQSGDMTRELYRWTEDAEAQSQGKTQRSQSFHSLRPPPESKVLDINAIRAPGGFRRDYIRRAVDSPSPAGRGKGKARADDEEAAAAPRLLTDNFIEFLSLYGHFAGEQLEEDDDDESSSDDYLAAGGDGEGTADADDGDDGQSREFGEDSALLSLGKKKRKQANVVHATNGLGGAILLLLKSFVGTGVLFLPKAYLNGGMVFSNVVLLVVSLLSFYCFVLLVKSREVVSGSFGEIGGTLYGPWMRNVILGSIVLSQIGFVAAYIVFTSQNLHAFILAVSDCRTDVDVRLLILGQIVIFAPLALIRDIAKLGATALVADGLILLGLIYLYWYDIATIARYGVADIVAFNPRDWTLFIGTAVFTFEGVGLIIPIQESMIRPEKFTMVLGGVMVIITLIFVSMGALSYAAYGSSTKTVIILNLPQDDQLVNAVQFFYSFAILLSTPLQLFPAIKITENAFFGRSGKHSITTKWRKNGMRFGMVLLCAAIAWGGADDLDKFVALVGSFACVPLVYVYPPLLHLKAVARHPLLRASNIGLCIFGFAVMIYTTVLTVRDWAGGPGTKSPGYCDGV